MKKKNKLLAVLTVGLLAAPMVAQAQYDYQLIDHPGGTPDTQFFGINDRGDVAGIGFTNVDTFPFVYASKKGTFTDVAPLAGFDTSVLGIADSGVLVGSVDSFDLSTRSGFIRDKNGNFTVFSHPDALSFTRARGVNNKGLVTGFRDRPFPLFPPPDDITIVAFVYDPKRDTYTDVIPESDHVQSIAQGINSKGEVVGSAFFLGADDPCNNPSFVERYGWWRATDGTVNYFSVNGWRTAARGINDSDEIVGFVQDPNDGGFKGFKVELDGSQCQSITIPTGDLLEFSGFDRMFPQGITNSGVIVGGVRNSLIDLNHGFIATPQKGSKKK